MGEVSIAPISSFGLPTSSLLKILVRLGDWRNRQSYWCHYLFSLVVFCDLIIQLLVLVSLTGKSVLRLNMKFHGVSVPQSPAMDIDSRLPMEPENKSVFRALAKWVECRK